MSAEQGFGQGIGQSEWTRFRVTKGMTAGIFRDEASHRVEQMGGERMTTQQAACAHQFACRPDPVPEDRSTMRTRNEHLTTSHGSAL